MKNILRHTVIVLGICLLCPGIPVMCSDGFSRWIRGGSADVTSSASVIAAQPSGDYIVLINRSRHTDEDALSKWCDFFQGKEIPVLFEDITCGVMEGDTAGLDMAKSFQSRLPEHQMKIYREDPVLAVSKAEYGKFDILLMSKEAADALDAQTLYENPPIVVIQNTNSPEQAQKTED